MYHSSLLILIRPTFLLFCSVFRGLFCTFLPTDTSPSLCHTVLVNLTSQGEQAQQHTIPIDIPAPAKQRSSIHNGFCVKLPLFWPCFQAHRGFISWQSWQHIGFNTPSYLDCTSTVFRTYRKVRPEYIYYWRWQRSKTGSNGPQQRLVSCLTRWLNATYEITRQSVKQSNYPGFKNVTQEAFHHVSGLKGASPEGLENDSVLWAVLYNWYLT